MTINHLREVLFGANIKETTFIYNIINDRVKNDDSYKKRYGKVEKFLRRLPNNKFYAGLESVYAIATIFKINILMISEQYGVKLVRPQGYHAQPPRRTVFLVHHHSSSNDQNNYFEIAIKIN